MRAFVKMRELLATHKDLTRKLNDLGEEIRQAVCYCLRCYPTVDGTARAEEEGEDGIPVKAGTQFSISKSRVYENPK